MCWLNPLLANTFPTYFKNEVLSAATYKFDIVIGAGGANLNAADMISQSGSTLMVESFAVPTDPAAGKTITLQLKLRFAR